MKEDEDAVIEVKLSASVPVPVTVTYADAFIIVFLNRKLVIINFEYIYFIIRSLDVCSMYIECPSKNQTWN